MRFESTARCALVLICCVAPASAGVIRVDAAGGGDFLNLQAAIDASVAGDILLVKPGVYGNTNPVSVAGKGITITADPASSSFQYTGMFIVDSIPAGQTAVMRGAVRVPGFAVGVPNASGILVTKCFGSVLIEDCTVVGGDGTGFFGSSIPGWPGIQVEYSAAVSIVRTVAQGGRGASACNCGAVGSHPSSVGGPGLRVFAARVTLHDSVFQGGFFGPGSGPLPSSSGGMGAYIDTAYASFAGGAILGGLSNGGGIAILSALAPIPMLDTVIAPDGGGVSILDPGGALHPIAGVARHFAVSSPVREQLPATLTIDGEVGDVVFLFVGLGIDAIQVPGTIGLLQASLPLQGPFPIGTLPAPDGAASITLPAPDLVAPGLLGFRSILQPFVVSSAAVYAAPPSSFVLVDSSL